MMHLVTQILFGIDTVGQALQLREDANSSQLREDDIPVATLASSSLAHVLGLCSYLGD